MAISQNIKTQRLNKQLTQKQLGDLLFVSDKTISKWESGRSVPDIFMIKKIASTLDISYEVLIDGQDFKKKDHIFNKLTSHIKPMVSVIILLVIILFELLAKSNIVLFTMFAIFAIYTLFLVIRKSRWYLLSLAIIIIEFVTLTINIYSIDLNIVVLTLFVITLITIITYTALFVKRKSDHNFHLHYLGNWNLIWATLIFTISFITSVRYSQGESTFIVNKIDLYGLSMIISTLLVGFHLYLYNVSTYKDRITQFFNKKVLLKVLTLIISYFIMLILTTLINLSMMHLNISSMYVQPPSYKDRYSSEEINDIIDYYGKDDVTLVRYMGATLEQQVYAYTSNFIDQGVYVHSYSSSAHLENISLLYGEIWEEDTDERVVVIDEDTAIATYDKVNAVGESFYIDNIRWQVIGVVSNTTARQENIDRAINQGISLNDIEVDSYIYIPYYFVDSEYFEDGFQGEDGLIVNTQKVISNQNDCDQVLDILIGESENYIYIDGIKTMKVYIITGSEQIALNLSIVESIIYSFTILILVISVKVYYLPVKTKIINVLKQKSKTK